MQQQQFVGLTMPVFTAFGWAGEETAMNFALAQLEEFIARVYLNLPRDVQTHFPFYGLDRAGQSVYVAANAEIELAPYFAFYARPMSFELQFNIQNRIALSKAWKASEARPERWLRLMQDLEPGWSLRAQQMEWDEESGETTFYQDLFKDDVSKLDLETAQQVAARAAFLCGEPKWIVPLSMSYRVPAEQAAMMGVQIIDVAVSWLRGFMPLYEALLKREPGKKKKKSSATAVSSAKIKAEKEAPTVEHFTYVSRLRPLHIRRGFVNLTPEHWPFFATNARSTSREVTLAYEGNRDKGGAIWRLVPTDQARVILSPKAHDWVDDNFAANDRVLVTASKLEGDEIEVKLEMVD